MTSFPLRGFDPEELLAPTSPRPWPDRLSLPRQKALRYSFFRQIEDVSLICAMLPAFTPASRVAAMGDDMEKCGVWPHGMTDVSKGGWLADFFLPLLRRSRIAGGSHLAIIWQLHAPLGRADLPTAAYTERMAWAPPGHRVRQRYHRC